jgi:MFS family permease
MSARPQAASRLEAPQTRWGLVALYALAYAGNWLAVLTPIMVTLALRVREISPEHAASNLSLVLSVGALAALVGNPLVGWLSDRTTSRYGMRRPWLIGGALSGCAALAFIAWAPTIPLVLLGWCLAQLSFNSVLAALVALLPDQIPQAQRGTVAGILGICTPVGMLAGTYLVQAVSGSMLLMFVVPAALGAVAVLVLACALPDRHLDRGHSQPLALKALLRSMWLSPRLYPDFAWVWCGRFMLIMAMAFVINFQPYYLINELGIATERVPDVVFESTLITAIANIVASLVSGPLSDFVGRRKAFVIAAAVTYGIGASLVASAESYAFFLTAMAIGGIGLGAYLAVDLALITDVLPNREADAAKDLGIFNIASALPQAIAPATAAAILGASSGDYRVLYGVAGTAAVLAALAIVPVRSVR